jgi:hypothetical protein
MRISLKREEWGLFDYSGMDDLAREVDEARDLFIEAMIRSDDPPAAARLADQSLVRSMLASERIADFHAGVFFGRRQQSGGFPRPALGVNLPLAIGKSGVHAQLAQVFEFVHLPTVWRELQPEEQRSSFDRLDAVVKHWTKAGLAVRGGPLLNFGVQFVPDWMYLYENDYEAISDFARDQIRRTVERYADQINTWVIGSGLHADSVFSFTFEQIMDLTRMAATVVRQYSRRSHAVLEITQPWGEYYARNQRTIPPMLYAEMAVQSGAPFDSFGLQFLFGLDSEGFHLRDFLQISALIDRLANLGKPLHVTAVAAPSGSNAKASSTGGEWHEAWSDATQAEWLTHFCQIALSKPYVESLCLYALADGTSSSIPYAGISREDASPKPALAALDQLRKRMRAEAPK